VLPQISSEQLRTDIHAIMSTMSHDELANITGKVIIGKLGEQTSKTARFPLPQVCVGML
jgi:hypothetical protein